MTIEQINSTEWLIKQDDWQLILSTAIQSHPDGKGGMMNESTILRDARVAMKNDFVNNPLKLDEYWALVQIDPSTAMVQYCLVNHPTIDIVAGIAECNAMTGAPIEVLNVDAISYKLGSIERGYHAILPSVLTETIPQSVHKLEVVKGVSVLNPQGVDVVIDYVINLVSKSVILNSNINLFNHHLIIY